MRPWYQNAWRLISHPYAFFEEAINRRNPYPATVTFIVTVILTGFGWWITRWESVGSWVSAFYIGGFLTKLLLPIVTYPLAVMAIYLACRLLVRETHLSSFFAVWGFSYLPTFLFFTINILAHILRQITWIAQLTIHPLLILLLWAIIFLILLWKLLLLTITLRLAGNLPFGKILLALLILGLITGAYWFLTFNLGWLKVPFI
ncbi:MAG TPA: hypothetical protein VHY08_01445 [Bacillota bacterium]|nr:hypothetical protein [Bacillota bacterium]